MSGFEATPEQDSYLRSLATAIAQTIFDSFSGSPEAAGGFIGAIQGSEDGNVAKDVVLNLGGEERALALGLPANIRFEVVFSPFRGGGIAGFSDAKGKTSLFLNVLPANARLASQTDPEGLWMHILGNLSNNASIIVHEVTHMLDNMRGGHFLADRPPPYGRQPGRFASESEQEAFRVKYINNPIEFNAHYQQAMFDAYNYLDSLRPHERRRIFRSFDRFKDEFASGSVEIGTLVKVTRGKWAKKLDQRLWQQYQAWKEMDWERQ